MTVRRVGYAVPDFQPCDMLFLENDGSYVAKYSAMRSFQRIERDGRWWRLNGRDLDTGQLIYLPEIDPVQIANDAAGVTMTEGQLVKAWTP